MSAHGPEVFRSILWRRADDAREQRDAPAYFADLNLDQIVRTITAGREQYDLAPLFQAPLDDIGTIRYRQEVMRDLEDEAAARSVNSFSGRMRSTRECLKQAKMRHYRYEHERLFLGAVEVYCSAVEGLYADLSRLDLRSRGMRALRDWLADHVQSSSFSKLRADVTAMTGVLGAIRYCLLVRGDTITVRPFDGELDYAAAVADTFSKFRQGDVAEHDFKFPDSVGMNHVEAQILEHVASLHPDAFRSLDEFCVDHAEFVDETVSRFDREVQFYVSYLDHVNRLRLTGLSFCYPRIQDNGKEVCGRAVFDLALARKLADEKRTVVCNDFSLRGAERILVVSGPNHGGKTTFVRTFGQLHHLASIGCPVPGTDATLFLFDQLFTHFERQEVATSDRGKLKDDLVRIRRILEDATPQSIVILNEIFSSTTLRDAVFLGKKIVERISTLDLLCVCVTFLVELASFDEKTVSMVSTVDPADPAVRTYKLERRPADGLAYALAVAERHGVTYDRLKERIQA